MAPDFQALYDDEFAFVWRSLRRLGVSEADLPDATHDVFAVIMRKWDEYDDSRPLRAWVFGIARRVAATMRRKAGREAPEEIDPAQAGAASPESEAACRELLLTLLDTLDEDQRVAFILHDLEGYTGPELAEMLGIPTPTAYSRIRLAREELAAGVERLRLRRAV